MTDAVAGLPEPPVPPGWSSAQLEALARVFDAFTAGGAERSARLAAAALEELAEPADLLQLKLALRGFDSRAANLLLGAGAVRFRELDEAGRDAYLLGWGTSRVPLRRTTFQLLKRLALFIAYSDPGAGGAPNPRWAPMGYRPRWETPTDVPSTIVPLHVERGAAESGEPLELEADLVVVGSGAGGGVVAARAAAAGRSVLVVEAGPHVPEARLPTNELIGFQRLFLDRGLTASADLSVAILAGAALGGGLTVNWTTSIDPPAGLRAAWAAEHGLDGFDGATTTADLARLRAELAVGPPETIPAKDALLIDGCRRLGWVGGPNERNAAGCGDCGGCTFGCRRGAKRAGARGHLAIAAGHGARFLVDAAVERIVLEAGHAAGVGGRLSRLDEAGTPVGPGRPFRVHARQVVVAAGALRTPVVLLRSGLSHPQIGRGLRLHPVPVVAGLLDERVEMWAGTTQASASLEFLAPGPAAEGYPGPAHGGFVIETAPAHPGLAGSAFPWEGRTAMAALMTGLGRIAPFIALVADQGAGRVRVTGSGRARVEYRIGRADIETARRAIVEMARLARAAGARQVLAVGTPPAWFGRGGDRSDERAFGAYLGRLARFDFGPNRGTLFSAHQMGTARAGADARTSVCDPQGRVRHGAAGSPVPGLYVADGSLFPTATGVNPQLTIMALAERVVRTVLADG